MNTYIIHYPKLIDRKTYLEGVCQNIKWCSFTTKDSLSEEQVLKFYSSCPATWEERTEGMYDGQVPFRELKPGDISCTANHILAWKDFIENDNNELGLFFEDDVILSENFYEKLDKIIEMAPLFDVLFLGGGFQHTVAPTISTKLIKDYTFILKGHPSSNCVCSYVLNKDTARIMVEFFETNKSVLPIDFEVNYILKKINAVVFHIMPMICKEGSSIGQYASIQTR